VAIYPGATVRLLDAAFVPRVPMAVYNRVNLHVTGGKGSPFSTFARSGAASSHFCVLKSGVVEQFVDTAFRAEGDLDGNDATISVETEGAAPDVDANAEPWTPAQVTAITALVAWLMNTHGIARKLASDSKPGPSSQGLSWHRLGIDGNFDAAHPGRLQLGGGMHYSTSLGKVCPGNAKIDQIPTILAAITAPPITPTYPEDDAVWVGDGITRRHVANPQALRDLQYRIGNGFLGNAQVQENVDSLDWLGVEVPTGAASSGGVDLDAVKAAVEAGARAALAGLTLVPKQ
jgi:hypothetical protein